MYIKSTMSIRFPSFSPLWCNHLPQLEKPLTFDNTTTSQVPAAEKSPRRFRSNVALRYFACKLDH